jgi:hypothetical protein
VHATVMGGDDREPEARGRLAALAPALGTPQAVEERFGVRRTGAFAPIRRRRVLAE